MHVEVYRTPETSWGSSASAHWGGHPKKEDLVTALMCAHAETVLRGKTSSGPVEAFEKSARIYE